MLQKSLALVCLMLSLSAHSVTVQVDDELWDIEYVTGTYREHEELLNNQAWWEDASLAFELTYAYKVSDIDIDISFGYEINSFNFESINARTKENYSSAGTYRTVYNVFGYDDVANYAIGYKVPSEVPLPAAAWLLGSALLGLGVIKRRKAA